MSSRAAALPSAGYVAAPQRAARRRPSRRMISCRTRSHLPRSSPRRRGSAACARPQRGQPVELGEMRSAGRLVDVGDRILQRVARQQQPAIGSISTVPSRLWMSKCRTATAMPPTRSTSPSATVRVGMTSGAIGGRSPRWPRARPSTSPRSAAAPGSAVGEHCVAGDVVEMPVAEHDGEPFAAELAQRARTISACGTRRACRRRAPRRRRRSHSWRPRARSRRRRASCGASDQARRPRQSRRHRRRARPAPAGAIRIVAPSGGRVGGLLHRMRPWQSERTPCHAGSLGRTQAAQPTRSASAAPAIKPVDPTARDLLPNPETPAPPRRAHTGSRRDGPRHRRDQLPRRRRSPPPSPRRARLALPASTRGRQHPTRPVDAPSP